MVGAHPGNMTGREGKESLIPSLLGLLGLIIGAGIGYFIGKGFWWAVLGSIVGMFVVIVVSEVVMSSESEHVFDTFWYADE